jgi:transcriptional repressor NrdR
MNCPFCNKDNTKVTDSRLATEGSQVRRRRECSDCLERFTTYETAELSLPRIIKSDGVREKFIEEKLRRGLVKALEKRPVESDVIDEIIHRINLQLMSDGLKEVPSSRLGEMLMDELRTIDQVAYVRFASVYRSFKDLNEFQKEIDKLMRPTS